MEDSSTCAGEASTKRRINSLDHIFMDLDQYDNLEQDEAQGWLNRSLHKNSNSIGDALSAMRPSPAGSKPQPARYIPPSTPRTAAPTPRPSERGVPPPSPRVTTALAAAAQKPSAIPRPSPRTPPPVQTPRTVPHVEQTTPAAQQYALSPPHRWVADQHAFARSDARAGMASPEEQAKRERDAMARIYDRYLNGGEDPLPPPQQPLPQPPPELPGKEDAWAGIQKPARQDAACNANGQSYLGEESPETSFTSAAGQHTRTPSWPALGLMDAPEVDAHTPQSNGGTYLQSNALFTTAQQSKNVSPMASPLCTPKASMALPQGYIHGGQTSPPQAQHVPMSSMDSNTMYKTLMTNVQMLVQAINQKKSKEDQQLQYLNQLVQSAVPHSVASSPEWSPYGPSPRGSTGAEHLWQPTAKRISAGSSTHQQGHSAPSNLSASMGPWQGKSTNTSPNSSFLHHPDATRNSSSGMHALQQQHEQPHEIPAAQAQQYLPIGLQPMNNPTMPASENIDDASFFTANNRSMLSPRGEHAAVNESTFEQHQDSHTMDESYRSMSEPLPVSSLRDAAAARQSYQFMLDEADCLSTNAAEAPNKQRREQPASPHRAGTGAPSFAPLRSAHEEGIAEHHSADPQLFSPSPAISSNEQSPQRFSSPQEADDFDHPLKSPRPNYFSRSSYRYVGREMVGEESPEEEFNESHLALLERSDWDCYGNGMDAADSDEPSSDTVIVRDSDASGEEQEQCGGADEEFYDDQPLTGGNYHCQPPLCPTPHGTPRFMGRRGHSRVASHAHSRRSTSSTADCASTGRALSLIDMAEQPLTSSIDFAAGLGLSDIDDGFLDRALPDANLERSASSALAQFLKEQAMPNLQESDEPTLPRDSELERSLDNVLESVLGPSLTPRTSQRISAVGTNLSATIVKKSGGGGDLVSVSVDTTDGKDFSQLRRGGSNAASPTEASSVRANFQRLEEKQNRRRPGFFRRLFTCHCAAMPDETV
eukprot:jgi/Tetstr1/430038/TSEL_019899.t1